MRAPTFAAAASFTLVLGIASAAAMFAIVHGVLMAPLSYGDPERLVSVGMELRSPELRRIPQPAGAFFTFTQRARSLDAIGFYRTGNANHWVDGKDEPERVPATWVTASTIPLLQVAPMLGRSFTADEDRARGPEAVVISESVWRTRFGASPDVVGRTLYVNSIPRAVVGVMPDRFRFPDATTKLWLPARLDRDTAGVGAFTYSSVARLSPGSSAERAEQDLAMLLPRMAEQFPAFESGLSTVEWLAQARPSPLVTPLREEITRDVSGSLWMLAAAAGLVLLVALANVVNLLLIRTDARRIDAAVREALGATRARIALHFFWEAVVLTGAAAPISLAAAWCALRVLSALGPADVPRLAELRVGWATVAFVAVTWVATAALLAIVPTMRAFSGAIDLHDGGRGATGGRARQRLRGAIVTVQVAIAFVVVAGAGLLVRTFQQLYHERPGFEASRVVTIWTQLPFARYDDSASVAFYDQLTSAVRQLPGVRAVGLTTHVPLGAGETPHRALRTRVGAEHSLPTITIDAGYLETLHIPLVAGRVFQPLGTQSAREVIVSRRAAAVLGHGAPGTGVLGQRLTMTPAGREYTVVGVAGDVRHQGLGTPPAAMLYVPQAVPVDAADPGARRSMALVVRTAGSEAEVVPAVRRIVRTLDPTVPVFDVVPIRDVVRASTARLSLALAFMTAAAAITIILGAVGIYGALAYMVALRRREIGVRIALGADPGVLARDVAARGLLLIGVGLVAGLLLLALAAPLLRAFLHGVTAGDPAALGFAMLALAATGGFASWLPARRAARVHPAEALRAE